MKQEQSLNKNLFQNFLIFYQKLIKSSSYIMSQKPKLPDTSLQVEMLNNKIFNQQTTKTMGPAFCDEITTQFVLDKLRKHEDQNTEINQKLLILQDILKKQVETFNPLNLSLFLLIFY